MSLAFSSGSKSSLSRRGCRCALLGNDKCYCIRFTKQPPSCTPKSHQKGSRNLEIVCTTLFDDIVQGRPELTSRSKSVLVAQALKDIKKADTLYLDFIRELIFQNDICTDSVSLSVRFARIRLMRVRQALVNYTPAEMLRDLKIEEKIMGQSSSYNSADVKKRAALSSLYKSSSSDATLVVGGPGKLNRGRTSSNVEPDMPENRDKKKRCSIRSMILKTFSSISKNKRK